MASSGVARGFCNPKCFRTLAVGDTFLKYLEISNTFFFIAMSVHGLICFEFQNLVPVQYVTEAS